MNRLDPEEKELLDSFDQGEWQSVSNAKAKFQHYREYAKATFKKDKRVNIGIPQKDLLVIQKKALEEGIPYQTLISSILYKYISGRLVEKRT
ncbi:antitoxin [Candidatus Desantisbacteria bacterium CG2_30_40_21]|uniref:Antitoxin n=4 Tax=unclassified Candidatus Desantisiibacteriota TaxID=3106372 RepID=A0A2M7JBV1_9BACT|nr:MAG: antitoxin [Candidatus Desantisbacteria bacterium CG2_30_40_21]PIP41874.1 MAG: antitoxin [Candidatus Desantisbacteria bacterium CG23_combo_of_CG06-09_8_20_14_all_40_23]PIX16910.1 MAG: antitoxin [Candidatus Desantisbacteria bacterium CG_4_8_14_3_um_filter_40_12]PJB30342.1 MAG: antitoxin [Candidatus Desantisbacteria bacterium CG_4_9_14_3_um_filter_40_11]